MNWNQLASAAIGSLFAVAGGLLTQRNADKKANKTLLVERHTEAYRRWRQLLWYNARTQSGEDWVAFMTEMQDWAAENVLYLNNPAKEALEGAVRAKMLMGSIGDDPATDHHIAELFKVVQDAGPVILANSPRIGR